LSVGPPEYEARELSLSTAILRGEVIVVLRCSLLATCMMAYTCKERPIIVDLGKEKVLIRVLKFNVKPLLVKNAQ
jgi:hypothetical protein